MTLAQILALSDDALDLAYRQAGGAPVAAHVADLRRRAQAQAAELGVLAAASARYRLTPAADAAWDAAYLSARYPRLRGSVTTREPNAVTRLCDRASGTIVTRGRR